MIKFNSKYKNDDKILSVTPFILLFWFNTVNDIEKILIIQVCICSFVYWNYKNIFTFLLDVLSANAFIIYFLYLMYKKNEMKMAFVFVFSIFVLFLWSFCYGQMKKRQIWIHLLFRLVVFVLFIKNIV